MIAPRDHGGGLDAAIATYGGVRSDWLDLSTGINPLPYPTGIVPPECWAALPDQGAMDRMLMQARRFWRVPEGAAIIAAPGASALIAQMPGLASAGPVHIPGPTYNEHAAAFRAAGHQVSDADPAAPIHVHVHPNNPDGRWCDNRAIGGRALTVIDESFCDIAPDRSHVGRASEDGVVILKSFGKFWGLAGLRLGFAVARPEICAALAERLGPWAVSGPALEIGARALADEAWAEATRARLTTDARRLDQLIMERGAVIVGGTSLFRLYDVGDAALWQDRLARHHVWSRVFPYSTRWLRLGLPHPDRWEQIQGALRDGGWGDATGERRPVAR